MKLSTRIPNAALAALCVLALGPARVFAALTPKASGERGIIKSVERDAHTLGVTERANNWEQKFQWNDQTKFSERDKSISASALKQGERVPLPYAPGGGTPVLQSVRIAPAKTERHRANKLSTRRSDGA